MVNENNKFIPKAPEQYTVCELKDQVVKKSPLSPAARSKVIDKTGSNYISSWTETNIGEAIGYGPVYRTCPRCSSNRDVSESTHKCPSCGAFFSQAAEQHERNKELERSRGGEAIYSYKDIYGVIVEASTYINNTFRLKIRIIGGTWWYYTADKTAGVGGESSWWDNCGFWTTITQFIGKSQWRTDQMLIISIQDARTTLQALNDGTIIVVNAVGCDSETSRMTKRNTIRKIERAIAAWERNENVNMDETA